jgi:hypothetical protein
MIERRIFVARHMQGPSMEVPMLLRIQLTILDGATHLTRSALRYELLERIAAATSSRGIAVVGFGFGVERLRLVVDGDEAAIEAALHGVRSATSRVVRREGNDLCWGETRRRLIAESELTEAVLWAHAAVDGDSLASPWTSHRDLLGFRRANFFDAASAAQRVDTSKLPTAQLAAGAKATRADLPIHGVLRVAAGVRGVLPADRSCFRLFVHLGRMLGFDTDELARALALTGRRIRQLAAEGEPLLHSALACFADPRLAAVP